MKIGGNYPGFNISAKGLSIQRKKMNIIAENIANADTIRTENGQPYKRKYITVQQKPDAFHFPGDLSKGTLKLSTSNSDHISNPASLVDETMGNPTNLQETEEVDNSRAK